MKPAAGNPSAPAGQLPLHKGAVSAKTPNRPPHPQRRLSAQARAVFNCPGTPHPFHRRNRGDAQEGAPSWVLFGSFSQRERTITLSTLQQSCRQPQSTILSQCSQVHTAQVTPLMPSRHTLAARGESQNTQALPQNIPSQSPSVTALPEGEPRSLRMSGCAEHAAGNPSAPAGAAPFTQGSLVRDTQTQFRIPHSEFRI